MYVLGDHHTTTSYLLNIKDMRIVDHNIILLNNGQNNAITNAKTKGNN